MGKARRLHAFAETAEQTARQERAIQAELDLKKVREHLYVMEAAFEMARVALDFPDGPSSTESSPTASSKLPMPASAMPTSCVRSPTHLVSGGRNLPPSLTHARTLLPFEYLVWRHVFGTELNVARAR